MIGACDDVTVQNCTAEYNGVRGIKVGNSTNCTVDNCTSSYNGASNIEGSGTATDKCSNIVIKNCTTHHARTITYLGGYPTGPFDGYGMKFLWCVDSKMHNNEVYDNEFDGIDLDGSTASGEGCETCEVYENKIYDNGTYGIYCEIHSYENLIYRNVLYMKRRWRCRLLAGAHDNELFGNIIYRTDPGVSSTIMVRAFSSSGYNGCYGTKIYGNLFDGGGIATRCVAITGHTGELVNDTPVNTQIYNKSSSVPHHTVSVSGAVDLQRIWSRQQPLPQGRFKHLGCSL